jgi:hypothetical protein
VPCIDARENPERHGRGPVSGDGGARRWRLACGLAGAVIVAALGAGCAHRTPATPAGAVAASGERSAGAAKNTTGTAANTAGAGAAARSGGAAKPAAPELSPQWQAYRLNVARQVLAASPGVTYTGAVPVPALAVPVFEIELAADGSIARIDLVRPPGQAPETTQIVVDALRRAEPFGSVTHLPKPWRFAEAYIFNAKRHFKPMSMEP